VLEGVVRLLSDASTVHAFVYLLDRGTCKIADYLVWLSRIHRCEGCLIGDLFATNDQRVGLAQLTFHLCNGVGLGTLSKPRPKYVRKS